MYISRIKFLPGERLYSFLNHNNPDYHAHQFLWNLFDNPASKRDFLYRQDSHQGMPVFYMVSERKPVDNDGVFYIETKEYNPEIKEGDIFSFSLRVNPVIAKKEEGKRLSVKHDVCMNAKNEMKKKGVSSDDPEMHKYIEKKTVEWLTNKRPEQFGYKIDPLNIAIDSYQKHRMHHAKKNIKNKEKIVFSSVDYSGLIEVEDPEKFKNMLFRGMGKSKAFGCGLMLIRRP